MDENTASTMQESWISQLSLLDYAIVISIVGISTYWFFLKKKTENEFDASTIKTFTLEPTVQRNSDSDSGFISKMKHGGRNMVVFYGSQTGTAEEFAARLAKEATRYGMKAMVADPEECEMDDLAKLGEIENSLAVFCVATYGEGDPTDNAQEFYEWLNNGGAELGGLRYAVFGLGNKTYEHYNKVGKYLDERLEQLGASRVFELGLGDDDANIEEDFITWKDKFWLSICEKFGLQTGEDVSSRQYQLIVHDDDFPKEKVYTGEIARLNSYVVQKPPFDLKNPYLAPITVNRELYSGSRSCMHIEIDIKNSKLRYEAGDHVAVYPENDTELVNKIGELLSVDLDQVMTLKNLDEDSSKKNPFPCPTTYRTALTYYLDITSTPRTHVLKEISDYTDNEEEKAKLKLMSSSTEEGKHAYSEWVIKSCRSIVHVLEDLPSIKPPIDHLCELLPRLQCRYYSISSSAKLYPESIHITAVVVEYETPSGRTNKGVATTWLKQKIPGAGSPTIPIFVRRSQFRLPNKPQTPIIMIGPGTGLAPFRGFIQERQWMLDQNKPVGDTILYFGCRKQSEDYLYREELEQYQKSGAITQLYLAFSRDQPEKVYVTHFLRENMQQTWQVIGEKNGHIYICGDARNMAREVKDIILETIQTQGNKTRQEAEDYLKRMESQKRYSADVWS